MCQWRKLYFPCRCERQCPASNVIKNDTIPRVTKNASENDAALHSHVVKNDTVPQVSWEWHCLAIVNENGTAPQVSMRMTLPGRCQWEWHCPARVNANDTVLLMSMRMALPRRCQWEWHYLAGGQWEWHCPTIVNENDTALPRKCQWEWHHLAGVNENDIVLLMSMRMALSFSCQWEWHMSSRCQWELSFTRQWEFITNVFKLVVPVKNHTLLNLY